MGVAPRDTSVAVVTDSTSYLPPGAAEALAVQVVPLQVIIGGVVRAEGAEIAPSDVAAVLARGHSVSTSRPSPALFADAYRRALHGGATAIVSVHLSAAMSGTVDAARMAAADVAGDTGADIRVVDSRSVAMGMGFAVLEAARRAVDGAGIDEVERAARHTLAQTRAYFYVATLEYLRRGGRLGAARALLGSAFGVKPLLQLSEGRIEPLENVRTSARAIARLEAIAVDYADDDPVAIAVHHLGALERAEAVAKALDERLPKVDDLVTCEVGAVVGSHTGPVMLAVVVCKR